MKKIFTITLAFCAVLSTKAQINSGSPAKPFNSNTGYGTNGILPTNLPSGGAYGKSQDAATAYDSWKSRFVSTCSNGKRVLFDDNTSTVSEGIAYGMLLSAYAGDKALFDDLWKFYKASANGNGFMNWKLSSCTSVSGSGGATDAELDAAMALIVAADQWPSATSPYNYKSEAGTLIAKIRALEVTNNQFNNGDAWGASTCRNPSYQSPAYCREFKKIETNQSTFWDNVTVGNNALLRANRNATTGLVGNWSDPNGVSNNCNNTGNEYGFDACRNPWRMATDVLWHGRSTGTDNSTTSLATDISDKIAAWAKNNADNFKGPLPQNAANPSVGPNKNGAYSTFSLAFMAAGSTYQTPLNTAYTSTVNLGNNELYFNATLRCINLFMMTGNFWLPGSNILTATVNITSPANNATFKEGVAVAFTASATLSNGTISKVEYYDGTTLLGAGTGTSYTFSTSTLTGGAHTIVAKAYDATNKVVAESPGISIVISGASDVSTTGVIDMMEKTSQLSEVTGGVSCATSTASATAGLFWFEDRDPATSYVATYARTGNGVLTYTLTKDKADYNVIGFNFGEYCVGSTKKFYYLDLTQNSVFKFTVNSPATNTVSFELKIQMKDSAGNVLAFDKTFLTGGTAGAKDDAGWYKYDIGFSKNHPTTGFQSLVKGTSKNFEYNFANALSIKDPAAASAANINTTSAPFNFKKVKEIVFTPLNSADDGAPNYAPLAFASQTLVFSNVVLGDVSTGSDFCTTPPAPTTSAAPSYCQGSSATALTATALAGLNLQWYTTQNGTASSTAPIPSTGSAGAGTYYVSQKVGLAGNCEGPKAPIGVTVVEAPSANAGIDQAVATGPSVQLTGTGSAVGTWAAATKPTGTTVTFAPSASSAAVTANGLSVIGAYSFTYTVLGNAPCTSASSTVNVNVTTVTGVEDAFLRNNVSIYPNPATDNLYVNLTKVDGAKTVKLVDTYGKVVFESSTTDNVTIPMGNLSEGMYFVQIQAASGTMTKSIVKK